MYDELIKALRFIAKQQCRVEGEQTVICDIAADAIEELSRLNAEITRRELKLRMEKPRWIPVTERMPEEYKDVLCYYEYFRYGDYNCMFRTIDRGYYGNGRWGGEAGQGHKNKVLAWMPLPEPPKEE